MKNLLRILGSSILTCIIIFFILLGIGHTIQYFSFKEDINSSPIEYVKEAELKYWECKSELVTEVQNYIDSTAPTSNLRAYNLIEMSDKYDIDIKFMLAQGQIESHFGTKGLARRTNSVWNVLAYDSLSYDRISEKGKYKHPNASIEPYCKLLRERYLVNKTELDLLDNFINNTGHRYASNPCYERELRNQYNKIQNNTKIDSLQDKLLYYKIRAER